MSFSFNRKGTKSEVENAVDEATAGQVPDSLKQYVKDGIANFPDTATIDVNVYGHARQPEGDSNSHSANITIVEAKTE